MLRTYLFLILTLGFSIFVYGQTVNNVRLVNHREYMVNVIQEVIKDLESRGWCNLKLSEFSMDLNETVFDWDVTGTVTFKNGFVVSIQRVDVLQSSLNQIWTWDRDTNTGTVEVRGTLRVHSLSMGYDVEAELDDGLRHYTAEYTHPMVTFVFSIFKNVDTEVIRVVVNGDHPRSSNRIRFLPVDNATQVFAALYDTSSTSAGVTAWGPQVFQPLALDIVMNRVPFPRICYNCAAS